MADADLVVVGGGIVGLATAMAAPGATRAVACVVLEEEPRLAAHQTGNNSGVIHSGLYYKPGSLKARNCAGGREALYRFCAEHGIPIERCGKVVVATATRAARRAGGARAPRPRQRPRRRSRRLGPERDARARAARRRHRRAAACRRPASSTTSRRDRGVRRRGRASAAARSSPAPGCSGSAGARRRAASSRRRPASPLPRPGQLRRAAVATAWRARCGVDPGVRIVPFRGEYYELAPARRHLVRNLIYPVPDPALPVPRRALHAHDRRRGRGRPNAVLAFKREGYRASASRCATRSRHSLYPGFWRLARRYWRTGLGEM